MTYSNLQQDIFDWLLTGSGHLVVEAAAGSGKTFTLTECARRLPQGKLAVVVAFGTDIAANLKLKLPYWVQGTTSHSLGKKVLERHLGRAKIPVDPGKARKIAKELAPDSWFDLWPMANKLLELAKSYGWGILGSDHWDPVSLEDISNHFELTCDDEAGAIDLTQDILDVSYSRLATIDFNDMLWLPLVLNAKFDPYDYVMADEVQDFNLLQHEFIARMLKPGTGRAILVGDPQQSIFAFRGADAHSMARLTERFSAKVLPLSICYRCSKAVIREALAQTRPNVGSVSNG